MNAETAVRRKPFGGEGMLSASNMFDFIITETATSAFGFRTELNESLGSLRYALQN
ncbi:MAG: hypothetical protein UX91_C0015G0006 [Candidatus Amesbacteria bacterium GW2011_GWB1_47_19]|nr:MAG: hypothetical protein UX91_C0015G0006 [Candidatus Amesbacteria bacterium GW2011_GWB1_47_19]